MLTINFLQIGEVKSRPIGMPYGYQIKYGEPLTRAFALLGSKFHGGVKQGQQSLNWYEFDKVNCFELKSIYLVEVLYVIVICISQFKKSDLLNSRSYI